MRTATSTGRAVSSPAPRAVLGDVLLMHELARLQQWLADAGDPFHASIAKSAAERLEEVLGLRVQPVGRVTAGRATVAGETCPMCNEAVALFDRVEDVAGRLLHAGACADDFRAFTAAGARD